MEVKIKDQDKLIDATIEMVDGVMVVSPKKERYEPSYGDEYFYPFFDVFTFVCNNDNWERETFDFTMLDMGWVFQTRAECQQFCDKLNQAINSIKP